MACQVKRTKDGRINKVLGPNGKEQIKRIIQKRC